YILANSIEGGFFVFEQRKALAEAIAEHYGRLQIQAKSSLFWAVSCNDPLFVEAVLKYIPKEERLAAVKVKNMHGNTVLHAAAQNPQSLEAVLALLPEGERLAAVKVQNNRGYTVLHRAAENPQSLEAVLALLPEG